MTEQQRLAAVRRVIARGSDPEAVAMAEGDFGPGMPFSVGRAGGVEGPCAKPGAQAAAENGSAGQEVGLTARPAMFASLTDSERRELANRLRRAGERFGDEANMLAGTPPAVLAAYCLPREGYHDFYSAAIEASMLSVEVWKRDPVCRTCGFMHPPEPECPRWAPEPARLVPTGTGWPL